MNYNYILLILTIFTSSCSSFQATVNNHEKLNYEAIRVYPEWSYKKQNGMKWIFPILGLSGGAVYGYESEFKYDDKTYEGAGSAAIWGGIGLISGGVLNRVIFSNNARRNQNFEISQSDKWVRDYNKTTGNNYIIYKKEPKNTLILVPKNRIEDLKRYDQAQIDREIAQVKADEDRIKIAQENRRKKQQEELSNEEKRRNLVNNLQWEPITITGEKEVYPSALITSTTYAGSQTSRETKNISNYIGFSFKPEIDGISTLNYEIEATDNKFITKSSGTLELNGSKTVFPDINWKTDELVNNSSTKPLKITFKIKDKAGNYSEKTLDLAMLSINECILSVNGKMTTWILPAYVNEQNPLIDEVLKEALDKGYISAWTGYQLGKKSVFQQVEAIWKVLSDREIRYSSITGAGNSSQGKIFSQHIRTVSDALISEQANCIDGSLLFASILKRIDIDPYIIIYPGHANLAFDVFDKNKKSKYYLEMTTLPNATFEQAIIQGYQTYSKFPLSDVTEVDVSLARKSGIKPFGK